jgi:Cu/Ag efflux pump CusA
VVGGLLTSTLVTLILIPTIYWLVESGLKRLAENKKSMNP